MSWFSLQQPLLASYASLHPFGVLRRVRVRMSLLGIMDFPPRGKRQQGSTFALSLAMARQAAPAGSLQAKAPPWG
jgi:hypothetical protein